MLALQALTYIEGNDRNGGPIWNYARGTLACWKGAEPDRVMQLNCGEVRTHANYKKNRTWENFNNRGTKNILFQTNYE